MSSLYLFPQSLFEQDFAPAAPRRRNFSCAPCTPADAFHPYSRAPHPSTALADPFAWLAAIQEQTELEERRQLAARRRRAEQQAAHRLQAALQRQYEVELELQRRAEFQRRAAERQRQHQLALQAQRAREERQRAQELARRRQLAIQAARHEEAEYLSKAIEGLFANFFGAAFQNEQEAYEAEDQEMRENAPVASTSAAAVQEPAPVAVEPIPIEVDNKDKQSQTAAPVEEQPATSSIQTDHLLFKHPFSSIPPSDISAENIDVSLEEDGKIKVTGLWKEIVEAKEGSKTVERPASPSRGRSLSPRRPRVRDVDENGDEIMLPGDAESDGGQSEAGDSAKEKDDTKVNFEPFSVTIDLPKDAKPESIRANLTDEGFELWVRV